MRFPFVFLAVLLQLFPIIEGARGTAWKQPKAHFRKEQLGRRSDGSKEALAPKVFIITMYDDEGYAWLNKPSLDLYANNVTVPGLSPIFPDAHCSSSGDLCLITTGEGEINAATSLMALSFSPLFNLTKTYFMITGNAGINPSCGTTGSVAFARYAVQVALQYEIDPRELPSNYTTGYIPQGAYSASEYPEYIYGTEVFELNACLRDRALALAARANLSDSAAAAEYRARYHPSSPAAQPPSVFAGDIATTDNWFSGRLLGEAFANFTRLVTNGTGTYCLTAQEDNGTLEALLRADLAGRVDYTRVLAMRVGSDFDRPPPGVSAEENLLYVDAGGYELSFDNMYAAGLEVIRDVRASWDRVYEPGIPAENYVGDIYDSLEGDVKPDFGLPADFIPS